MRKMIATFALLIGAPAAMAIPTLAQAEDIASDEAALIAEAERRGKLLYDYDQAAWHGTDAMVASVDNPASLGHKGWVVTPEGDSLRITFYGPGDDGPEGKWTAIWTGEEIIDGQILAGEGKALDAEQLRLIAAYAAIDGQSFHDCGKRPLNSVFLPGATPADPISVYLMTPQVESDVYPLGGHTRFDVVDGTVVARRSFMNSCFWISTTDKNGRVVGAAVDYYLDPVPTEIHVFSMLAMRIPLIVNSYQNRKSWGIESFYGQPKIRELE